MLIEISYLFIFVNLTESSSVVIPAEAGIHSGKHDGLLPSQE